MEALINQLQDSVRELHTISLLRADATALAKDASMQRLNATLDSLDARIRSAHAAISSERLALENDAPLVLADLERTKLALEGMISRMPKHLPRRAAAAAVTAAAAAVASDVRVPVNVDPPAIVIGHERRGGGDEENVNPLLAAMAKDLDRPVLGDLPLSSNVAAAMTSNTTTAQAKKICTSISPITVEEFDSIPRYLIGRLSRDKMNDLVAELNKIFQEKYTVIRIPHAKMTKQQRDRFWQHKKLITEETKGMAFVTEADVKENHAKSAFKMDPIGRALVAAIRHLGRIKEVRGGGTTRIVIV